MGNPMLNFKKSLAQRLQYFFKKEKLATRITALFVEAKIEKKKDKISTTLTLK